MSSRYISVKREFQTYHVAVPEELSAEAIDAVFESVSREYHAYIATLNDSDDDKVTWESFLMDHEDDGFFVLETMPYFGE